VTGDRERDAALVRLYLAANEPALLRLLDKCRQACGARMTRYLCPLFTVSFFDHLGRRVQAQWRGPQFTGFIQHLTKRRFFHDPRRNQKTVVRSSEPVEAKQFLASLAEDLDVARDEV